jgi:hypothetical protein
VELFLPDGRSAVAQVDGGNGHSGVRSPDIHFGLGAHITDTEASMVELRVKIRWRNSKGKPREEELILSPGWFTILLGESSGAIES